MSLPREPRQKMINMMYLVLTALLALNVSAEILNAFKTVNHSLETTNTTVNNSTSTIMQSLEQKTHDASTAEKAKIWYPNAQKVQLAAKAVNDYIQSLKDDILTKAGGDPKDDTKHYKDDNLDIPTRVMIDKGGGKALLQKLTEFKQAVLAIDPVMSKDNESSLSIDLKPPKSNQKSNKSWEYAYFHMVPVVAAQTILSKFQNDVKTTENKLVQYCHEQVGKVILRNDAFAAIAVADANYVLPGQKITITAGVGGFSTAVKPKITIGGTTYDVGPEGTIEKPIDAGGLGEHSLSVHFAYKDQDGVEKIKDVPIKYTVGQSNAAVQLDKMNVLFIGVDNPITVSGSGSADQLKVGISGGGGALTRTATGYTVRVNQETDQCIISVTTPDGKTTPVRFRVRSIPDPTPFVGGSKSGDMSASNFKSQAGVRAIVENFFYETQFNVTGFRITGDGDGFEDIEEAINTGATWKEALKIIGKCRPGSYITIEDIRAVGPDGRTRKLTPMIFTLK